MGQYFFGKLMTFESISFPHFLCIIFLKHDNSIIDSLRAYSFANIKELYKQDIYGFLINLIIFSRSWHDLHVTAKDKYSILICHLKVVIVTKKHAIDHNKELKSFMSS